jgi:hypothetical protein
LGENWQNLVTLESLFQLSNSLELPFSERSFRFQRPGLPDGLFSNQNPQFGKNFQGLRLENVDIFYDHLKYFMDFWDIS